LGEVSTWKEEKRGDVDAGNIRHSEKKKKTTLSNPGDLKEKGGSNKREEAGRPLVSKTK